MKVMPGKTAVRRLRPFVLGKLLLACLATALISLPQQAYAAKPDTITIETKTFKLDTKSFNSEVELAHTFPKEKWQYCIIKCSGNFQHVISGKPSQKFIITINQKKVGVINEEIHGEKIFRFDLDGTEQELIVKGRMETCNLATSASGTVEVICLTEKPGVFYITKISYDTANAVHIAHPPVEMDSDVRKNHSKQTTSEEMTVRYTNKRSVSWQETSSHSEHFGFSIGYKPGSATGGPEGSSFFEETIRHDYSNGEVEETSKEQVYTSKFDLKPGEEHRMFVMQNKETWEIPYVMEGYTWSEDGTRTYSTTEGKYIFNNSVSNVVMHDDPSDPTPPVEGYRIMTKW